MVIVGLVGLFAVTVIRVMGGQVRLTVRHYWKKVMCSSRSGVRKPRRDGDANAPCAAQALLEEMAGQPGVLWFAVTVRRASSFFTVTPKWSGVHSIS